MKRLLLLLLICGLAFSTTCVDDATAIILTEQGTNIVAVVMFTAVFIACVYAAGKFISNPSYIVFAKDELYHLGFSVVLLVIFSSVVLMSCSIADIFFGSVFSSMGLTSSCYSAGSSMHSTAVCYANEAQQDANNLAQEYIKGQIDQMMESTFSWSIQWPLMNTYTSSAGAYRRVLSSQYELLVNSFVIPALVSISMQKLLLDFVSENAITWILPIAFILRIFIPTRQMGNMLIALTLGVYIILPFMYSFNFAMYEVMDDECTHFEDSVCDAIIDGYGCSGTCDNANSFWNLGRLIPLAFFLPNLTIVILIAFLSAVHKALSVIG